MVVLMHCTTSCDRVEEANVNSSKTTSSPPCDTEHWPVTVNLRLDLYEALNGG